MLVQVDKFVGHGKTEPFFVNADQVISIGHGHNAHMVEILLTDSKTIEVSGDLNDIAVAFSKALWTNQPEQLAAGRR